MFTKCLKKKEVKLEVKKEVKPASWLEVKLFELDDTTRLQTIVHEQGSLTPASVSKLTSSLTPNYANTELCVDLKLLKRKPGRLRVGKCLEGVLAHDGEEHYTFIETDSWGTGKRNPHVYEGEFITITRRSDGSLRPNFKLGRIGGRGFNLENYAFGVACELREALRGLVENDNN